MRMRERNPRVYRMFFSPMSGSSAIAILLASDSMPIANPSRWGSGPVNSTNIHVMMVERRTIDEMR